MCVNSPVSGIGLILSIVEFIVNQISTYLNTCQKKITAKITCFLLIKLCILFIMILAIFITFVSLIVCPISIFLCATISPPIYILTVSVVIHTCVYIFTVWYVSPGCSTFCIPFNPAFINIFHFN